MRVTVETTWHMLLPSLTTTISLPPRTLARMIGACDLGTRKIFVKFALCEYDFATVLTGSATLGRLSILTTGYSHT
jgi:hypothetical protein